jgi:ankyrin repeat protein
VRTSSIEEIGETIEFTIDVNERDERHWTPLMHAIERGDSKIVKLLLESGAYVDACDYDGTTPLLLAADHASDPHIITVLLEAGADVFSRNRNYQNVVELAAGNPALKDTELFRHLMRLHEEG